MGECRLEIADWGRSLEDPEVQAVDHRLSICTPPAMLRNLNLQSALSSAVPMRSTLRSWWMRASWKGTTACRTDSRGWCYAVPIRLGSSGSETCCRTPSGFQDPDYLWYGRAWERAEIIRRLRFRLDAMGRVSALEFEGRRLTQSPRAGQPKSRKPESREPRLPYRLSAIGLVDPESLEDVALHGWGDGPGLQQLVEGV
jgi:hypothetical protein